MTALFSPKLRLWTNICFIGMPGCGKTTIGRLLATFINWHFIDVDRAIEARLSLEQTEPVDMTLPEIIARIGHKGFLSYEATYMRALSLLCQNTVIAPGGSIIYNGHVMRELRRRSLVIFLDVSLPVLIQRINGNVDRGIIMKPGQTLEELYRERLPLYEKFAHVTVSNGAWTPEQVIQKIGHATQQIECPTP